MNFLGHLSKDPTNPIEGDAWLRVCVCSERPEHLILQVMGAESSRSLAALFPIEGGGVQIRDPSPDIKEWSRRRMVGASPEEVARMLLAVLVIG